VIKGQIDATYGQINDFETTIQKLDNQIALSMEKGEKLNDQIRTQQGKIVGTEAEIEKAKNTLDTHKKVYTERLKSIQYEGKQSIVTYAELLLSSTNISELLTRVTAISQIMESNTDLLNGLNEKEQVLKDAEVKLHNEFHQLEKSQAELVSEQKKIEEVKKEIETELADAVVLLQDQQGQLAQQEAERQVQLAQQEAERQPQLAPKKAEKQVQLVQQQAKQQSSVKNVSKSTPSVDVVNLSNSETSTKLIAYAKQFLGVPYVYGGSTPSGFDCSGFTSYVYRSVGINLPRVSRDQQNVGTRIPLNQVQPGDLLFRGSPAYHVAIYIGGGQYIHAPQTGDVVKIASYNPSKFTNAVRVLR
ncbi:MAG: C40 family peptidase, partial [Bacillus sp. (in: Bacteria)]|nr:C40 family peptidase [Bacillus sp. (in: firmicutes)]